MNEESSYCSRCKSYHAITMFINPKKQGKLMRTCSSCRYSKSFDYYFKKYTKIIQSQTRVEQPATQPAPVKYVLGSLPVYINGDLFYKP